MRVIAGQWKGRRLVAPPGLTTRPMLDRVKEALFASLGTRVRDARVLDLYAGSGQLALEALSRGAAAAVLVESDAAARQVITRNVAACRAQALVRVVAMPVEQALGRPGAFAGGSPDLVFCDPPYALPGPGVTRVLELLASTLETGSRVVLRRPASETEWQPPVAFSLVRRRKYGDTQLLDLDRADPEEDPTHAQGPVPR